MPAPGLGKLPAMALIYSVLALSSSAQSLGDFEKELITLSDSSKKYCVRIEVVRQRGRTVTLIKPGPGDTGQKRVIEGEIRERTALSGVLLDSKGHVATLGNVLQGACRVTASICDSSGERNYKAEVVGFDPRSNIGVIRLEREEPFPAAVLGDSDSLKPGSFAMGLGFPFDLGPAPSVSVGIVSATQRDFIAGTVAYPGLIEASFPLIRGEQGGMLVNSSGEIVGLLFTSFRGLGQPGCRGGVGAGLSHCTGLTLAIPINTVRREVEKIIDKQRDAKPVSELEPSPWIGLVAEEIKDSVLRHQLGLSEGGVMVVFVYPGQSASKAGIERHDILVEWNGSKIADLDKLAELVNKTGIAKKATLKLIRSGAEIEKQIVIGRH